MFAIGMPGTLELVIILGIVVVVFGATRLPAIGDGMGKMITNFRSSMKKLKKDGAEKEGEKAPKNISDA